MWIFEADTINQAEMKDKKKSISDEQESFSKPNSVDRISSKKKNTGVASL